MGKAQQTRRAILEKSFQLIYENGYQATSIDKIIETTDVTKGAFFYHFKNKDDMGLAMIKEVVNERIQKNLIEPLDGKGKPLDRIYNTISQFMMSISKDQLIHGCPTNNLTQEMAPLNGNFLLALKGILEKWEDRLVELLEEAKVNKEIQKVSDTRAAAKYIVAGYEGARGIGKLYRSKDYYELYLSQLKSYLDRL